MTQSNADFDSLLPPLNLTRRGFIVTSLATGFAAAAGSVAAQNVITTDTQGLTVGEIRVPTADGEMPAYRAAPAGKTNLPVILVVQEIFGVHEHIKDICRRLAKAGYLAIAPELYARQGDASKYTEISALISEVVSKVPDAQVMDDLDASVAWAGKNGGDVKRLGITGFCWGGRITWLYAAHNPAVKAGVAWYGKLVGPAATLQPKQPIDIVGQINGPVLGLYGGKDSGIPLDSIETFKAALANGSPSAKASTFNVYPDAPHAFNADYRPSYRQADAQDGWQRTLAWFSKYLG
jgi:carboxymethylenebutenolidase